MKASKTIVSLIFLNNLNEDQSTKMLKQYYFKYKLVVCLFTWQSCYVDNKQCIA